MAVVSSSRFKAWSLEEDGVEIEVEASAENKTSNCWPYLNPKPYSAEQDDVHLNRKLAIENGLQIYSWKDTYIQQRYRPQNPKPYILSPTALRPLIPKSCLLNPNP